VSHILQLQLPRKTQSAPHFLSLKVVDMASRMKILWDKLKMIDLDMWLKRFLLAVQLYEAVKLWLESETDIRKMRT